MTPCVAPTSRRLVFFIAAASPIADPNVRLKELPPCETVDHWVYLERPEVHGLRLNLLGVPCFKYAWIDETRRVQ